MSKIIKEENLVFTEKTQNDKDAERNLINTTTKVKIMDTANAKVLNSEEFEKREALLKFFDYAIIAINILTNIVFFFFLQAVLEGISYSNGLVYEFTTMRVVGIIIFAIAQITGLYLFVKMFKSADLRNRLLLVSAPLLVVLLAGTWAIFNVQNFTGKTELAIISALGLENFDPAQIDFKYIIIAIVAYLAFLYFIYGAIFKSANVKLKKKKK